MAYLGREFVLESQENFDTFLTSLGSELSDEAKKAILNHKATLKLVKNGDKYTLSTSAAAGAPKELTFQSGVEFTEQVNGNPAKTTITVDGDTLTQVQKFDKGQITIKREFSDNKVVTSITSDLFNGTAKRIYKA